TQAAPSGRLLRAALAARGRRVAAGLGPQSGVLATVPAWWGARHWVEVAVPAALAHGQRQRHHPVDPDTARRVARCFAEHADRRSGRGCRPTNERIAEQAGVCVRTVQRVRRLLEDVGVMVKLVEGRSILTRAERIQAWRNGSSCRQIAAEVALVLPRWLARHTAPARRRPVHRVTPPGYSEGELVKSPEPGVLPEPRDRRMSRAAPGTHPRRRPAPVTPAQLRAARLIAGVQRRVSWLSTVSPRRLTALHRFAAHGWTERDVHRALDEVLTINRWSVPDRIDQPAAYLARLLRDVDPADRPGAYDEAQLAEEKARREWIWQTTFSDQLCEHGQPAGNLPHPFDGHYACPFCRHEKATA
ncbi:MAG: hypothetical protein J0H43_12310, partial [Actinobacteria bacterium]|nr:hypothetical protein [Actinomycetota bacterium]